MGLLFTSGNTSRLRRLHTFGKQTFLTIIIAALLPAYSYGQMPAARPVTGSSGPNGRTRDLGLLRHTETPSERLAFSESKSLRSSPFPALPKGDLTSIGLDWGLSGNAPVQAVGQGLTRALGSWKFGAAILWTMNREEEPEAKEDKGKENNPVLQGSPGHIFWVVPAFKVNYGKQFTPLTPREKFDEWARAAYNPLGLGVGAFEAGTLEHSSTDGFCGYGKGWGGYGECFGALEFDANVSSFIGDYALTVLLHQDPRYFRLGEGSFGRRVWYAVSRVFVTYNDSGRTVFYSSALSGTVIAAGLSNLYYPQQDRGAGHTLSRIAIDLGNTALYNEAAEFWPDIRHKL